MGSEWLVARYSTCCNTRMMHACVYRQSEEKDKLVKGMRVGEKKNTLVKE